LSPVTLMIMFSGQTAFLVEKCRIGLDFHRQDLIEKIIGIEDIELFQIYEILWR